MIFPNSMKKTKGIKVRTIAFLGIYVAIFLVMTFVPQLGYIRIWPFNATMMAIPVSLATIHFGWRGAIFGLVCFALSSLIGCLFFQLPIVALGWGKLIIIFVIGRFLIFIPLMGVILAANFIRKRFATKNQKLLYGIKYGIKYLYAFVLGLTISIFNTMFVGLLMYAFLCDVYTFVAFATLLAINIAIEWTIPPTIAMMLATLGFYLEYKEYVAIQNTY